MVGEAEVVEVVLAEEAQVVKAAVVVEVEVEVGVEVEVEVEVAVEVEGVVEEGGGGAAGMQGGWVGREGQYRRNEGLEQSYWEITNLERGAALSTRHSLL